MRLNELPDENRLKIVEKEKETAEKEFQIENNKLIKINQNLQNETNNLDKMSLELEKL